MTDNDFGPVPSPDPSDSALPTRDAETNILATEEGVPSTKFLPLDPRVVDLWRLNQAVGCGFLLLLGGFGVLAFLATEFFAGVLLAWLICAGLSVWFVIRYPLRAYRAWGYRIDERVLEIRSGLLVRNLRLLPLSRIQHVDLQRGPFERMFGLASLVLYTAGTRSAAIALPGLNSDEAVQLRDHLLVIGGDDAV